MRDQLVRVEQRENVVDDRVRSFSEEDGPERRSQGLVQGEAMGRANREGRKGLAE